MADERQLDPWARYAWVFGTIWVVFLYFPITGVLESGAPPWARSSAAILLLVFGVLYIAGYIWLTASADWRESARRGAVIIGVLAALMLTAVALAGLDALGATAFIVAISMFTGLRLVALAVSSGICALLVATLLLTGAMSDSWFLLVPPALVFATTATVRGLIEASERHDVIDRQLAVVAERERVARDVHDVLGHSLTVVTVKAELAERLVDLDPERAKSEIAQIRSLSREALAEVRATVSGLRVARLGDELASARVALEGAGVAADVPSEPDIVDPRRRIVVAWTLREAVTNVVRHSRAERCVVTLEPDAIAVEDDGIGTPDAVAATGLRGIRERAEAAGARLTVGRGSAGRGTRVEVRW